MSITIKVNTNGPLMISAADAPRVHRGNMVVRAAGWLRENL